MATISSPAPVPPRRKARWRRTRRRSWTRPSDMTWVASMFAAIPSLPRCELARLTEALIDRMDEIDGDPDLEDTREDWEDSHDRELVDEG